LPWTWESLVGSISPKRGLEFSFTCVFWNPQIIWHPPSWNWLKTTAIARVMVDRCWQHFYQKGTPISFHSGVLDSSEFLSSTSERRKWTVSKVPEPCSGYGSPLWEDVLPKEDTNFVS
jgi:hypothetical protein